jgi:hypothetical protein
MLENHSIFAYLTMLPLPWTMRISLPDVEVGDKKLYLCVEQGAFGKCIITTKRQPSFWRLYCRLVLSALYCGIIFPSVRLLLVIRRNH